MSDMQQSVSSHYGVGRILDTILGALAEMGKDIENFTPSDLAPVDEFHIRGREATVELADRAGASESDEIQMTCANRIGIVVLS